MPGHRLLGQAAKSHLPPECQYLVSNTGFGMNGKYSTGQEHPSLFLFQDVLGMKPLRLSGEEGGRVQDSLEKPTRT